MPPVRHFRAFLASRQSLSKTQPSPGVTYDMDRSNYQHGNTDIQRHDMDRSEMSTRANHHSLCALEALRNALYKLNTYLLTYTWWMVVDEQTRRK